MARSSAKTEVISEQLPPSLTKPEGQERVVVFLHRLVQNPPQVLLLEGGIPEERLTLALYWTALLNCPSEGPPCQKCMVCRQIQAQAFRDLHVFSGVEEAIKIDQVREARASMGQRPDHGSMRVIVIHQAQELTPSAANSLLKAMEEPQPGNVFVLLAPLRAWLLPTLVSRSLVLTLSWSGSWAQPQVHVQEWQQRLVGFWRLGRGLFELTSKKGEVSRNLAQDVLTACQKSLLSAMQCGACRDQGAEDEGQRTEDRRQESQEIGASISGAKASQATESESFLHGSTDGGMAGFLAQNLDAEDMSRFDLVLHKAHQALNLQTTPALVLDWVGIQGWSMIHK